MTVYHKKCTVQLSILVD